MNTRWLAVFLFLPCAFSAAKGLSDSDWSSIQKEHLRHRQAVVPVEGGWRSQNYRQNWSAYFDGQGFEVTPGEGSWRWGLRLISYGYPGQQRRVRAAKSSADVETFAYQWDSNLREWYVNGEGLEHGYTLAARPGDGKGLQFHLEVRGMLKPQVARDGSSVAFVEQEGGRAVVNYSGLKVTDASGRQLAAYFEAHVGGLRLEVNDAGARYPITVDPLAQQAYLRASNAESGDGFGFSIGVDGNFVVVGAPFERSNGSSETDNSSLAAGAAYLFYRAPSGWTQVTYIKASNPAPAAGDRFGYSVGISGDRIVVGAWGKAGSFGANTGAVYVFRILVPICDISLPGCLPSAVSQEAYLQGSYGTSVRSRAGDRFGWSVAIGRDPSVSLNGYTIVVGSPYYDGIGESPYIDSGAAFIFTRSGTTWTVQAYLEAPTPINGGYFGTSVAISGNTVVVGELQNGAISFGGRAYVFTPSGGVWTRQATLAASNAGGFDSFGWSVAMDVGAPGSINVLVGAPFEDSDGTSPADNSKTDSGAVYLFTGAGAVWSQQGYIKAPTPAANEQYGSHVAISGDTWIVGTTTGKVFVFRSGVQTQLTATSNGVTFDRYGCSLAASGDTVAVGACNDVANALGGAAYIFSEAKTLVSIAISAPLTSIPKGTTDQFTATGTYSDGSTANITSQVTWNSSSAAVTIVATGLATGAAAGSSDITATLNGVQSNLFALSVTNAALVSIQISAQSTHLAGGATEQFQATGTYTDGSTANLTSQALWNSSNTAAVTISANGVAKAVSLGSSNISATVNGIASNLFTVTVDCAANLTSEVTVTRGPLSYNFLTARFVGSVTVKNTGANAYVGPVSLVLDNLSPNATLANASGTASCNLPSGPYVKVNTGILSGQQVTFTVQFTNSGGQITYSTRVLAGPFPQ